MSELAEPLRMAITAARVAAGLLRDEFHRPGGPRGEAGHAEVDGEAERAIRDLLMTGPCQSWRWLGEELGRAGGGDSPYLWLVDPNDGTSAYLKGWRGSAVSIAALRDGLPVLGVVLAWGHPDDEGDLIAWAEDCPATRNGAPLATRLEQARLEPGFQSPPLLGAPPAVVFVSQAADRASAANAECVRPARFVAIPSIAYRLALVAAGEGIAAVSLASPCGWDYAAGHALLRGVGASFVDESGREVTYSIDGTSHTTWCFGGAPAAVETLRQRDWRRTLMGGGELRPPYSLCQPRRGRAIRDAGRLARTQGCLLGQVAGDALGGLVEFRSAESIRGEYPDGPRELIDGGGWRNLAGQPTDDSEMALMLARSLVHEGRYDRGAALEAYLHWWPRAWDRGGTLSQALGAAMRGATTDERLRLAMEHSSRTSQSNGALMRISPLGVFAAGLPASGRGASAVEWARADAALTHPHVACGVSCAAFTVAIATAIAEGEDPEACHRAALAVAAGADGSPSVHEALVAAAVAPPSDYESQMGWVLIALQNAFYQLLHARDFESALVDTVSRGGDTDTNGAIAGALLGAVLGREAIPARWRRAVLTCRSLPDAATAHPQPPEYWPVDALWLAEALLARGGGSA